MADLERQGIIAASEQYGAIDSDPKKGKTATSDKLPLFLGRWEVSPDQLYNIGLTCYVAWFVVHRVADLAYLYSVDARFPAGLGHLYPSEAQRLESVSYTREVLMCGMIHRCLVFCVVFTMVYFRLFARFDTALRSIPTWWAESRLRSFLARSGDCCCTPIWKCLCFVCYPIGYVFHRPIAWCGKLKDHTLHGRLATDIQDRFGFRLTLGELFLGSMYLTLIGAVFFALSAPFAYWMQTIDLKFGFANSLSVSMANFEKRVIFGIISMILFGWPQKMLFLAVLQYRLGWVFMWAGLMVSIMYAQFNVAMIAPMLGMDMKFPTASFAVGRGFPLAQTANKHAPWVSLNRLYFPDKFSQSLQEGQEANVFYTDDKSKGQLVLANKPAGKWSISGTAWFDPAATVYATTAGSASKLNEQEWSGGSPSTRMGVRSGKELRDKLFGFARERALGIGQIYMVDGSHKDARANAFVTGAGNHSIIGLYDTLFLGQRGKDASEDSEEDTVDQLAEGKSLIQHASEVVQDMDVEAEEQDKRPPRNSAPTQAMNDDEIVAILAHELAHSGLKHMEMGMAAQFTTSLVTFATLGWMSSSPLAGAALSLTVPILHVGACAYDHLVAPTLEGFLKLFTDGLTRHNEYEADAYAAQISEKYGTGLQTALAKLSVNSNQDPDPPTFFEALHADHPTFAKRWAHIEEVKKKAYGDRPKQVQDVKEKP